MATGTIDKLSFEISGDAAAAAKSLDTLATSLEKAGSKVGATASKLIEVSNALRGLNGSLSNLQVSKLEAISKLQLSGSVASNMQALATALQQVPSDAVTKLANLSSGLQGLSGLSLSSTFKNLGTLANGLSALPADAGMKLKDVVSPLKLLAGIKITSGSINQLKRLPEALKEFEKMNFAGLITQIEALGKSMTPLANNVGKLSSALKKLPPSLRTTAAAARTVASTNKVLAASFGNVSGSIMASLRWGNLFIGYNVVKRVLGATVGEVSNYVEDMNLFTASMGEFAESAATYGKKVQDAMGIDLAEWSRAQGVFQTMITGFGDSADRAAVMSQNLTQLGYDLASFYNLDVETAMEKIQSGMSGQMRPMLALGYDLSQTRMQIEATNLGIEKSVSEMTQAEKAALRYRLMMTQVTQVQGDMARTLNSPANQLRVLRAQLTMAARAIGNLFIPAMNAILPVVIGVVKAIRMLAQEIANFFGLDVNFEVDYSGMNTSSIMGGEDEEAVDAVSDSIDDMGAAADKTKKKVKELKNSVMGFDELNKLNDNSQADDDDYDTGASAAGIGDTGSGTGMGLDIPLDTYDFMKGLDDTLTKKTDEIAQKFRDLLPIIGLVGLAIGTAFAAAKLFPFLSKLGYAGGMLQFVLGMVMTVVGAAILLYNAFDAWNNGLNFDNLLGMLGGIALMVVGLTIAFGPMGGAIGLVIGGIVLMTTSLHDFLANGPSLENMIGIIVGFGLIVGGLALAFQLAFGGAAFVVGAAIGLIIGGLALLVAGFMDFFQNGPSPENTAMVVAGIMAIGAAIALLGAGPIALIVAAIIAAVAAIAMNWDWLCENVFGPFAEWVDTNVIQPVVGFFSGLIDKLAEIWDTIVQTFWDVWGAIADWVNENVIEPLIAFWTPIANWFKELWDSISATAEALWHNIGVFADGCKQIVVRVWEVVSTWFDQKVIQPVAKFFSDLWDKISLAAEIAWIYIRGVWEVVSTWFDNNIITPVTSAFDTAWNTLKTGAEQAWEAIKGVFSTVASFFKEIFSNAWEGIISIFQFGGRIFDGVVDAISSVFRSVMNNVIEGLNWAIAQPFAGLNAILAAMRDWEILGIYPFAGFWDVPVPQIPYLAEGRRGINAGQLFVARERGAELVGAMGSHTTVANNQQIIEGIEQGVVNAMLQVAPAFTSNEQSGDVTLVLRVDSQDLAHATARGQAAAARRGTLTPELAFA